MRVPWLLLWAACPPPVGPSDDTDEADDTDETDVDEVGAVTGLVRLAGPGAAVDPTSLQVLIDGQPAATPLPSGLYRVDGLQVGQEVAVSVAPHPDLRVFAPRLVTVPAGAAVVDLLALVPEVQGFDPAAPVTLSTGALSLQVGAVGRAAGGPAVGPATARLTVLDPWLASGPGVAGRDAFPGSGLTEDDRLLAPVAGLDLELRDADGAALQPLEPVIATFMLPPERCLADAPPAWSLDEATGRWVQEGATTVDPTACTLSMALPHLSTWSAAEGEERVVVQGSVRYANGARAAGASVTVTGAGYGWSSTVATGPEATWSTWARPGEPLSVAANVWAGGWFYQAAPVDVDGASVVDPTVVDVVVELDEARGCDPDVSAVTHTFHLTLAEAGLHHVWAPNLATCGTYEPLEVWPFFSADLVLYAWYNLETPELRLDGPYLYDRSQPALVGDWGVQPVGGVSFDTLTTVPAGGYRREHLGLPVDWQFILPYSGGGGVWAVRTRAGLYGKLEISRISPTGAGFDVDVRWRLQSDGRPVLDP